MLTGRATFAWVQSVYPKHLLGAVEYLFATGVQSPTARLRQLLRFRQIRLTPLELLLGQFMLDSDAGEVRDLVDDSLITLGRSARLAIVHCERRNHFAL